MATLDPYFWFHFRQSIWRSGKKYNVEKGRDTEIHYINGLIGPKGHERHVATPFNDKIVELVTEAQHRRGVNNFAYLSRFDALLERHAQDLPGQLAW